MKVRKIRMLESDMDLIKDVMQDRIRANKQKCFRLLSEFFGVEMEFSDENFNKLYQRFETHVDDMKKLNQKKRELYMLERGIKTDDENSIKFLDAIKGLENAYGEVHRPLWENGDLERIAKNAAAHTHFYTEEYEPDEPDPEAEARFWDAVMY
ncbi:MAG: hypothetical protein IJX99_03750 [Clostridia bacterium]|nr:hypothetical protein [Clostridia bacterium]